MVVAGDGNPRRVALFIPSFEIGGAEGQALTLANTLDKSRYAVTVIALRREGALETAFRSIPHVRVVALEERNPYAVLRRLLALLRELDIRILHSFLTATNVYCLGIKVARPSTKVIVGIRDSLGDAGFGHASFSSRFKERFLRSVSDHFSFLADLAIVNSQAAKQTRAVRMRTKSALIRNGIDTDKFRPDPSARQRLRDAIATAENTLIVGILGNCSAYKDYPTFIRAASTVAKNRPDVHFVSIGRCDTLEGERARRLVEAASLGNIFHFMGPQTNVARLLPGFDVMCSSSVTEALSNAIAESMACGVPCVVTDVGDSRMLVGETGIVVPIGSSDDLARSIVQLLEINHSQRALLGGKARQRIVEEFGLSEMTRRWQAQYENLISAEPHPAL